MLKTCSACKEVKDEEAFPKNGVDALGVIQRRADCNTCYKIRRKVKSVAKFNNNTKHRTGEISTLTLRDWTEAMIFFKGACAYCATEQSRRLKLTKEHVVAVTRQGTTERRNIVPACTGCNSSKGDRDMETWFRACKFFSEQRLLRVKEWCRC